VATFSSSPCLQPLTLQGQPQISLEVHADQPGFDLCVALSRLPAGSDAVEQLSTGVLRQRGAAALKPEIRRVTMQPLLAELSEGDRLRVSIAGAAWPAIGVNSGHPDIPCDAPSASHRVIAMTLRLAGSQLTLNPLNSGRLQP
jgi:predicted acyl esterase